MIAYTVTKRAADVETTVRVEVPEHWERDEREEELAMALNEVSRDACAPTTDSTPRSARELIEEAVLGVDGVAFVHVVESVESCVHVWARMNAGILGTANDIEAIARAVNGVPRRFTSMVHLIASTAEAVELVEAARLDERIKIPAYDTKPFRDRIAADREVFAEIEKLTRPPYGDESSKVANLLAGRAVAAPVPA